MIAISGGRRRWRGLLGKGWGIVSYGMPKDIDDELMKSDSVDEKGLGSVL